MAGVNLIRRQLYDKYKAQGMSDEEAMMKADSESQAQDITRPKKKPKSTLAKAIAWGGRKRHEFRHGKEAYLHETPEERKARVKKHRG